MGIPSIAETVFKVFLRVKKVELPGTSLSYLIENGRRQIYLAYALNSCADPWHFSVTLVEDAAF